MKYSRKRISKEGKKLLSSKSSEEVNNALSIINEWRTNHLHPLNVLKNAIIRLLDKNEITPYLVSQRLKRITSIEYKLDLKPDMGLGGMNDIGGIRIVLKDSKQLAILEKILLDNRLNHKLLPKPYNYILYPKKSGYRSVHFVYEYNSKKIDYNKLKLELQIRTVLQHNWATAVETAGIITKTSLKSSKGPDEWLDFFKIVSSLFSLKEKLPVLEEHKDKSIQDLMIDCYVLSKELDIITILKGLRVSANHIDKKYMKNGDYYLIHIKTIDKRVVLKSYTKNQFEKATKEYVKLEKEVENTKDATVLVSAQSFKSLKKAYPSYFLDTSEFIKALEKINKNCIDRKFV
ncbi:(p)ppGpp synthetase [Polaribacter sp. ALD11]|uniref:RelA/SpoT domain-containing protein n=1 Tax=Polaribacter sp. ALD11 TaxID=2058137 RepID=UPI000C30245E|nr:RelA/SpoT domain-containing protein [Polaribacter sp. ALD11]AUC84025.1 (p)ppGpp synthetase [Polaribacter sp. ALD11]